MQSLAEVEDRGIGQHSALVEVEDGADLEVMGEDAEADDYVGFKEEIDGDPDCKVL
jgi:hypothetical protein